MRARKRLGQHFLSDPHLARRIVEAVDLHPEDVVLEIGPGRGALTRFLSERAARVLAVEIDEALARQLAGRWPPEKVTLIIGDILKLDLDQLLEREGLSAPIRVFGNLPYNIATAILQHLLRFRTRLRDMTVMLQREVADRILSPPGSKSYGYLSIFVQYHCEGRRLFTISPSAFRPSPKVFSTVVHLRVRERPAVEVPDEEFFFDVVSALFAERRKTIWNNLKRAAARLRVNDLASVFQRVGLSPLRRAETLALEELAALTTALFHARAQEQGAIRFV
ncbi:MAG: 16S rRNA (adenine(1518)-N(6)/adenine(1519)-N(6))-dimethyltransferase RsmA [Acidobacteriota bacterium]|nr:16S rRNA (adenine(1518)-N(6)/adenine(1519)-N(6))-dimethyltransferase RsmA [Acidobacteriota bacterium]